MTALVPSPAPRIARLLLAAVLLVPAAAQAQRIAPGVPPLESPAGSGADAAPGVAPPVQPVEGEAGALRVLVTASEEATVSGEIDARIESIGPGDGETFRKGDVLVRFDCSLYNAQLAGARAELTGASATLATKSKLDRLGSTSGLEVALAKAAVAKSRAAVRAGQWRVDRCAIRAPFDGRVVKRLANAHEVATTGQELLRVVSTHAPEARVIAPSRWAARVKPGDLFDITLEETGKSYRAKVISLGAKIDPASQSIEIRGKILDPSPRIVIGMSGIARFGPD